MTDINYELHFFSNTINEIAVVSRLPHECLYELHHALNHIAFAGLKCGDVKEDIGKAKGHIQRAHLDFLKICLLKIHETLKDTGEPEKKRLFYSFHKAFARARIEELGSVGGSHVTTVSIYKNVVSQYHSKHARTPVNIDQIDYNQTRHNYLESYLEWTQLEAIYTSLRGQRVYDVVYSVVGGYLWRNTNFIEEIKYHIASLKAGIIQIFLNRDVDNELEDLLKTEIYFKQLKDDLACLRNSSNREEVDRIIERTINVVFPVLLRHLDINLLHSIGSESKL